MIDVGESDDMDIVDHPMYSSELTIDIFANKVFKLEFAVNVVGTIH